MTRALGKQLHTKRVCAWRALSTLLPVGDGTTSVETGATESPHAQIPPFDRCNANAGMACKLSPSLR